MIVQHHLVFGRKYGELFKYPVNGSTSVILYISTINDNLTVNWGDGSSSNFTTDKNIDYTINNHSNSSVKNYSSAFSGDIIISSNKANDIYSLKISPTTVDKLNILNFETFINQFKSLYSLVLTNQLQSDIQRATLIGDLSKIPDSLERFKIEYMKGYYNNTTDFYLNVSNFSQNSKLKYFSRVNLNDNWTSVFTCYGDLSKLPPQIQYFNLEKNSASTFTYTAGKTWESSFDTLNLGNGRLKLTDTDNLLIDMNNSITTAIGSKVINLANCLRTSDSDVAVAGLESKGFTVTCTSIGTKYTITFDLGQNVTINGSVTRAEGHDGRLNAIQFGSGNLVSADPLPASTTWSIAFWMKSGANNTGTAQILTNAVSAQTSDRLFGIFFNIGGVDSQICASAFTHNVAFNNLGKTTGESILNNTWRHYVIIIDTTKPAAGEISIYIDKVGKTLNKLYNTDNTYTFKSSQIQIGLHHNSTASMSPIKMFNYPLSQNEIDNLYNE